VLTSMVTLPRPPGTSLDPLTSHLDGEEVKKITEKKISRVLEENVPEVREWEAVV
jgi:hypothetical protein